MKKLTFALIFAVYASSSIAAARPEEVRVSLELLKNGVQVSKAGLSMLEGRKSPYSNVNTLTYAAACEPNSEGEMIAKPSSLTFGMMADVTPVRVDADGVLLSVAFNYSELLGMKSAHLKGCTIQSPTTHTFGNMGTVQLKPGQQVELAGSAGSDKYVLVVRGL